jgi:putative membrane protein
MGGMMGAAGPAGAWLALWIVLGAAVLVAGGVLAARARAARRAGSPPPPARATELPGAAAAQAALRLRYANGQISREDYLQGKVELED